MGWCRDTLAVNFVYIPTSHGSAQATVHMALTLDSIAWRGSRGEVSFAWFPERPEAARVRESWIFGASGHAHDFELLRHYHSL